MHKAKKVSELDASQSQPSLTRKQRYLLLSACVFVCVTVNTRRRRRFRIDTEIRCVGAHPPFWPFQPVRVKAN